MAIAAWGRTRCVTERLPPSSPCATHADATPTSARATPAVLSSPSPLPTPRRGSKPFATTAPDELPQSVRKSRTITATAAGSSSTVLTSPPGALLYASYGCISASAAAH
eukprot:1819495-Pleurochrysis_carterae.AAC.4